MVVFHDYPCVDLNITELFSFTGVFFKLNLFFYHQVSFTLISLLYRL